MQVEQAVEEAVRGSVLPALADFQAHLSERLMEDMRSEMLQSVSQVHRMPYLTIPEYARTCRPPSRCIITLTSR